MPAAARKALIMQTEFDVQLTEQDLYRFQMINAYRGTQGWSSVVLAIVAIAMYITRFGKVPTGYSVMYLAFAAVFFLYVPGTLFLQSKAQFRRTAIFHGLMHYTMGDEGLALSAGEESALLPWSAVYRVVATGNYLLIYSGRANAYIIPKRAIDDNIDVIKSILNKNVEDFRLKIKKL